MNLQLHHPGSKQQLEEVWEQQDHMEDQEFNPKTFFYLHGMKYYHWYQMLSLLMIYIVILSH